MVPQGMTKVTWPFVLSMSSGTLLRLNIEASSGRITVAFVESSAVRVQYLPVFDVKSVVKYDMWI